MAPECRGGAQDGRAASRAALSASLRRCHGGSVLAPGLGHASGVGACACSPSRLARRTLRGQAAGPLPYTTQNRLALSHTIPWGASSCGERPARASESPQFAPLLARGWARVRRGGYEVLRSKWRPRRNGRKTPRPPTSLSPRPQRSASGAHPRPLCRQAAQWGARPSFGTKVRPSCHLRRRRLPRNGRRKASLEPTREPSDHSESLPTNLRSAPYCTLATGNPR